MAGCRRTNLRQATITLWLFLSCALLLAACGGAVATAVSTATPTVPLQIPNPTTVRSAPTMTLTSAATPGAASTPTRAAGVATTSPVAVVPTAGPPTTITVQTPSRAGETALTTTHTLTVPGGFQVAVFAAGLQRPRFMAISQEGDLVVSDMLPSNGRIVILPDRDHNGSVDEPITFVQGLRNPHGVAFHDGYLYVAEEQQVVRFRWQGGKATTAASEVIVPNLPTGGHATRTIGFGPDGKLYLTIGSSCNVCEERDQRRAAIMQYNADGSGGRVYAKGLRNAVGFVWRPGTSELWATNNGRDNLGDDIPPETINLVRDGNDFGWPYCHNGRFPDRDFGRLGTCSQVTKPAVEMQAHSAPLGLAFYTGTTFPADYRGNLIVAFHGSWNRTTPTGYKLVRVSFANGQPTGQVEDLISGWLVGTTAWGRPVDVLTAPDGSLFVTDDSLGVVYRIAVGP